jgi:hypothetical protein
LACFSERDDNDRTPEILPQVSSPQQKDNNNDYNDEAETATVVMEWRTHIEATAAKKENQNNQEYDQAQRNPLSSEGVKYQHRE